MPRGASLVISCATLPGQPNPQPLSSVVGGPTATETPIEEELSKLLVGSTAAESPITEDLNKRPVGPTVPATVDHALTTGDAVGTVTGVVSPTWTALESLGGILSVPALENLVKAIDELAKVCAVTPL